MKLLNYDQMQITMVQCTPSPGTMAKLACDHTMYKNVDVQSGLVASQELLKFLVKAEHTSVLEHCFITFAIRGVSRSLLAQLTRQRMSSITSQSQHYQDYSDAPMVIRELPEDSYILESYERALDNSLIEYKSLVHNGDEPKEEARQVLPNAAAVNILWTVNARSLMLFLRQRLCRRNVAEMEIFATKVQEVCTLWWPELFELAGPPCIMDGHCNQGKMRAKSCK